MIGQTISHYKVLEKLGEGGMGVVYRAEDITLKRIVALKFLPHHVTANETNRARLIQEAQAAATLNHPNICTIYGLHEVEGAEGTSEQFIEMEYVDGEDLRHELGTGKLKLETALTYAIQIGEALQEAHGKGIVHRDIKADNVMVNSKNQIKVMDFGLAKLKGSLKLTRSSSTVGTLAYMAPEQIQGGEVDARSDIFAFGVLLFEMLSGKLPFRGEHEAAMMYSIMNEEPQPVQQLVPDVSGEIVNILEKALEKDPAERYQNVADFVVDLRRVKKHSTKVSRAYAVQTKSLQQAPETSVGTETPPRSLPAFAKKPVFLIGLAVTSLTLVALGVWLFSGPSLPPVNPSMEVSTLQIPATEYQYPGISPDGKWVTFPGADLHGKWDIYMMFIETGENKRVTTDSSQSLGNAATARFSPDGSSIVYSRRNRQTRVAEVCVVSVLTGQVRVIADTGVSPQWSPAGDKILYYRGAGRGWLGRTQWREYWTVSPQGGDASIAFVDSLAQGGSTYFTLGVSPDGKKIVFTRPMQGGHNEIFVRDLETNKEKQITFDNKDIDEAIWASNGYILFTSNRSGNFNIWAIPETGGKEVQITSGAGPDVGVTLSTTANRLVYSQRMNVATLWMVNTDGRGHRQVFPDENIENSHLSPDGNTLILQVSDPKMLPTLMIREISGGRQEFLFQADSAVGKAFPRWSPNGKLISYAEFVRGRPGARPKILDLAGGRRVRDLGEGFVERWISDSVVRVMRNSSRDSLRPNYSVAKLFNLNNNQEYFFYKDSTDAQPLLNSTAIGYIDGPVLRLLSMETFRRNPSAQGTILGRTDDASGGSMSDSWFYYRTANRNSLWKLSFKTLQRSKIIDLLPGDNINFGGPDYNDKIITYSIQKLKTRIVKIDKVFLP